MNNLIKFWKTTSNNPPFVHKKDLSFLNRIHTFNTYNEYMDAYTKSETRPNDFHLGLIPVPYIGDLQNATIFILMLNPGFSHEDYIAEESFPTFRRALQKNLMQTKMSYPFLFLNPEFLWTGGGRYWEKRFSVYAKEISTQQNITYGDALGVIANKVACLELVPYHSECGVNDKVISNLESVNSVRTFFCTYVLPKAINGEVGLVIARGHKHWKCEYKIMEQDNIVMYTNGEARGASFAPHTRGGRVLQKYLFNHGSRIV